MSEDTNTQSESPMAKIYQRTPGERVAIDSMTSRRTARSPMLKLSGTRANGKLTVGYDHPDQETGRLMMMNALGTVDPDFANGLISQLLNAGTQGQKYDGKGPNFMLAVIQGVTPRDEVEALLAAQMAAVHMATMTFARRLAHTDNILQQNSASNAFNKLARTFAAQLVALKRYRTGGEQKVTVHHVTVNEGGQAIVGSVSAAPGGGGEFGKGKATP